jgi:3-deoxy-D-manno-octulosonic-acid transferase
VHGPNVWNFAEIYSTLDEAKGAKLVTDEETLLSELSGWLDNPVSRRTVADAGHNAVKQLGGALERTLAALDPYFMQLRLEHQRAS